MIKFNNDDQFQRNKYIYLMNVVSAMLNLNSGMNCQLSGLVFSRLAYNYAAMIPKEQEKIKQVYYAQLSSLSTQFNQSLLDSYKKIQQFEQVTVQNYIQEIRQLLDQEQQESLRIRLAVHLNNVIDALMIDDFFDRFILAEESRFQKQPYLLTINNLTINELITYIDSKI